MYFMFNIVQLHCTVVFDLFHCYKDLFYEMTKSRSRAWFVGWGWGKGDVIREFQTQTHPLEKFKSIKIHTVNLLKRGQASDPPPQKKMPTGKLSNSIIS